MKKFTHLYSPQSMFQTIVRSFAWMAFHSFFRVRIHGLRNLPPPGTPFIMACNHTSAFDPILAGWIIHRPVRLLARTTLLQGFSGYFMRLCGAHPIQRDSADRAAFRAAFEFLEKPNGLVLYPEGTRSHDGKLQEFRGGVGLIAAKSGALVVPVYMSGLFELFPRGRKIPKPGPVTVQIGDPIDPSELQCPDSPREWYDRITETIRGRLLDLEKTTAGSTISRI